MKQYENVSIEILSFSVEDIIRTSDSVDAGNDNLTPMPDLPFGPNF